MPTIDLGSVVGPQGPQGAQGATGATGAQGSPGPNQVSANTSCSLTGVLKGNNSKVTTIPVDSTPDAAHTGNLISSAGVANAMGAKPNPNLLDNWYFPNVGNFPVNQIGQLIYNANAHGIDRWYTRYSAPTGSQITLNSAGLVINKTTAVSGYIGINQAVADYLALCGKTVTFSVLVSDFNASGTNLTMGLYNANAINHNNNTIGGNDGMKTITGTGIFSVTVDVPVTLEYPRIIANPLMFGNNAVGSVTIAACKLEIGSQQTLAHQENGVWVLNEMPNYQEQLTRCRRYFTVIRSNSSNGNVILTGGLTYSSGNRAMLTVYLPTEMVTTPTVSTDGTMSLTTSGSTYEITAHEIYRWGGYYMTIRITGVTGGPMLDNSPTELLCTTPIYVDATSVL